MWRKCFKQRSSKRLGLLLLASMFLAAIGSAQNASATVRVSAGVDYYGEDYDLLAEYGEWMDVQPYGVVWCPYVEENWAPFYDGRWIRTSGGWAWDSYEPFGELVYHYGYWYYEDDIGWFWVPGDEWSPARVQWYTHGDYCGWAPIPPPNYYWPDPWDYSHFNIWIVVHLDNFCDNHIGRYGIDRPHYRDMFRRDHAVRRPPDFQRVERFARRQIPVQSIARRPMKMRTDRSNVAERSAIRREGRARETFPENRNRVTAPSRSAGVERRAAIEKRNIRSERQVAMSRQNARTERQVERPASSRQNERRIDAPRQNARTQRQAIAPRQNARNERRAEAPARDSQRTQSRKAEKRSDRTDRADKERTAR